MYKIKQSYMIFIRIIIIIIIFTYILRNKRLSIFYADSCSCYIIGYKAIIKNLYKILNLNSFSKTYRTVLCSLKMDCIRAKDHLLNSM